MSRACARHVVVVVLGEPGVAEPGEVGHDHLEPGRGQRLDVPPPDPLRLGPPVQQEQREPARALAHVRDLDRGRERARGEPERPQAECNLRPIASYDPKTIEPKWQQVWADESTWHVSNDELDGDAPTSYVLEMLPYPSGEPHIGHLKNYSIGDAIAHFRRRNGARVLHPMGYDAFGLPAENHAIKTGQHPRESTEASIAEFRRQFQQWGISIDWDREFGTHEPRYYRWTQWIFLRLFEKGLAYRKDAAVNWCPQGRHGARERAGDRRRAASAAARRSRSASSSSGSSGSPTTPTACSTTSRRSTGRDHVVTMQQQLDRPLRGRRGGLPLRGARHRLPGLHHAAGHALRRDLLRDGARAPRRAEAERLAGGARVHRARRARVAGGARRRGQGEDRRPARATPSPTP